MNRYTLLLPTFLILLFLFAGISFATTRPEEPVVSGVPHNVVYGAHCDPSGNCWFATWGGIGVYSRSEDRWTSFTPANSGLGDKYTHDVAVDNNGLVWIALHSGNGVSLLDYNDTLFDKSDDH